MRIKYRRISTISKSQIRVAVCSLRITRPFLNRTSINILTDTPHDWNPLTSRGNSTLGILILNGKKSIAVFKFDCRHHIIDKINCFPDCLLVTLEVLIWFFFFVLVSWRSESTKRRSRYRIPFVLNFGTSILRISSRVVYEYIGYLYSLSFVISEQTILRFVTVSEDDWCILITILVL